MLISVKRFFNYFYGKIHSMAGGMGFTESELIRVDDVLRFCKAEDAFIYNFFEYFPKYG